MAQAILISKKIFNFSELVIINLFLVRIKSLFEFTIDII
jgi:hypothetical protein